MTSSPRWLITLTAIRPLAWADSTVHADGTPGLFVAQGGRDPSPRGGPVPSCRPNDARPRAYSSPPAPPLPPAPTPPTAHPRPASIDTTPCLSSAECPARRWPAPWPPPPPNFGAARHQPATARTAHTARTARDGSRIALGPFCDRSGLLRSGRRRPSAETSMICLSRRRRVYSRFGAADPVDGGAPVPGRLPHPQLGDPVVVPGQPRAERRLVAEHPGILPAVTRRHVSPSAAGIAWGTWPPRCSWDPRCWPRCSRPADPPGCTRPGGRSRSRPRAISPARCGPGGTRR